MADSKISALTAGVPLTTDILPYVDLVAGATKKTLVSELLGVVQSVSTGTGAVATGTTTMSLTDTIPTISQGTEFMNVAITPTDTAHILDIEVVIFLTSTGTPWIIVGLFQDAITNALAASLAFNGTATAGSPIVFRHRMAAGTTSSTTFRVRAGPSASATVTFNGQSGGRLLGGVLASRITVREMRT